ncbi:MAG TPA: DUF1624 domain-containing protein [Candidatus Blautia avicola]|uniref:DUF1624 domain-containing protein n=1 Tax=Candidatus Blautia avicola TaxID=2838483 RepID=A0A9D2TY10_9FIRM|nr:DUF1624 domain-containing protein [Candidatus Blautia avicola]
MTESVTGKTKTRYYLVDALRGLALINMVLYHFSYDVFVIYGQNPDWLGSTAAFLWQQGICWSFILISGFSWRFGAANSLKRGLLLNGLGLLITAVTWLAIPDEVIFFGILNFIGCGVLLTIPFSKSGEKIPPLLGAGICLILFALTYHIPSGYLQIGGGILRLPDGLYSGIFTILGFPGPGFYSSDYFPVLPWIFLYWTGWFLHPVLMKSKGIRSLLSIRIPLLSVIGRKTIWVYVLHQPILMGICILLSSFFL